MSGQSHTVTNLLPDLYGLVRDRFQINRFVFVCFFSEKYANFIHRQGGTDYKSHGLDFRKGLTVTL